MPSGVDFDSAYYDRVQWSVPDTLKDVLSSACAGLSVLDVGCGIGVVGEVVVRVAAKYTGVDISAHAVSVCTAKGLEAFCADAMAVDMSGYDLVLALEVLEHLSNPAGAVERMAAAPRSIVTVPRTDDPTKYDDPTHVSLLTAPAWLRLFAAANLFPDRWFEVDWGDRSVSVGWGLRRIA
jgi:SAM-dependent methyltransferase